MKKSDVFYKIGFWTIFGIVLILILFMIISNAMKGESEKALTDKGYEFINVYEELEEGTSTAILEMNSQGRDRFYEILTGLQALIKTYQNADTYKVVIYENQESCEYSVEGELYREYDSSLTQDWFDSSLKLHFELKQAEIC